MKRAPALLATALLAAAAFAQTTPPRRGFAIEITEPADQEPVLGKTRIVAAVKIDDPRQVDRVEFMVGDKRVFVDREPPYECVYDFGEDNRTWTVRATAYHVEGVSVSDAIVTRRYAFSAVERVNRVILWATATDKQGQLVANLKRDDFRVLENDAEQQIVEFYIEDRPITLAILLDSSGSMREKIKEVHAAAGAFVDTLRPQDQGLVIDFDDSVYLIQDMTSDRDKLRDAVAGTEALGATSIYDALHAAYRKIGTIEGRKAIVLLSDGDDTSSQFGFKRVLEEVKSSGTIVYTIGLGGEGGGPHAAPLKELSEVTGGRYFRVDKASELVGVYEEIALELSRQYYLTYETGNTQWDGRWMKVEVQSRNPNVKLRARQGYFAVRSPVRPS